MTTPHPCQVTIDPAGIEKLASYFEKWAAEHYTAGVIISDNRVFPLYGDKVIKQLSKLRIPLYHLVIEEGEVSKTVATATSCWNQMAKLGMDRRTLVISLGGGMISDLAGFVAGCYMRGVDVAHIPTTLLGMVDAAIGGKTGVNLSTAKNMIGVFHHPKMVLIDPSTLKTLDQRHFRAGLAEVIKYGVIQDADLFHYLEHNMDAILDLQPEKLATVISRCCMIKANIVKQDERDHTIRAILNYGHTFAHAIEAAGQFKEHLHGEAVAIGMSCAAALSVKLGHAGPEFIKRQDQLILKAGLSIQLPAYSPDHLIQLMAGDKKTINKNLTCILAHDIGNVSKVDNINPNAIKEILSARAR